jgi:hypothetical protein
LARHLDRPAQRAIDAVVTGEIMAYPAIGRDATKMLPK